MIRSSSLSSYGAFHIGGCKGYPDYLSSLALIESNDGVKLLGINNQGALNRVHPGYSAELLVVLEGQTKAVNVFSSAHFSGTAIVSLVGSSLVLEWRDGRLVELDQSQTRFGLSESTIYVGDCMRNVAVQATRSWVNLVSSAGNAVFRVPNAERVFACSSRAGSNKVLVSVGDGDLRGKGRVIVLEVLADGRIVEKAKRDFLQEVIDVTMVDSSRFAVITADNSIYSLSLAEDHLKITSHIVPNMALKSITTFSNQDVIVGSNTGVVVRLRLDPMAEQLSVESSRMICAEALNVSDPITIDGHEFILAQSSTQSFLLSNGDLEVIRIEAQKDLPISSLVIGEHNMFGISSGDLLVLSRPPFELPKAKCSISAISKLPSGSSCLKIFQPAPNTSHVFLTMADSSPLLLDLANPSDARDLYSMGSLDVAIPVSLNEDRSAVLGWSQSRDEGSLSLLEYLPSTKGFQTLWTVPFLEQIFRICQIDNERFAVTTSEGTLSIYSLYADAVPRVLASIKIPGQDVSCVEIFSVSPTRLVLINREDGGVSTCFHRPDVRDIVFTSVPSPVSSPVSVSACSIADPDLAFIGTTDGRIRLVAVPASAAVDEQSTMKNLKLATQPDLCMATTETVGELVISPNQAIASMVANPETGVVYFSTQTGLGVLSPVAAELAESLASPTMLIDVAAQPDPLVRHRLKGNWTWSNSR